MKVDEVELLVNLAQTRPVQSVSGPNAVTIGVGLVLAIKRVEYILGKWVIKGWWDHGTTLRGGWLTLDGLKAARKNMGG